MKRKVLKREKEIKALGLIKFRVLKVDELEFDLCHHIILFFVFCLFQK